MGEHSREFEVLILLAWVGVISVKLLEILATDEVRYSGWLVGGSGSAGPCDDVWICAVTG